MGLIKKKLKEKPKIKTNILLDRVGHQTERVPLQEEFAVLRISHGYKIFR